MENNPHTLILGQDSVALATAYALLKAGHSVTIIDGRKAPKSGYWKDSITGSDFSAWGLPLFFLKFLNRTGGSEVALLKSLVYIMAPPKRKKRSQADLDLIKKRAGNLEKLFEQGGKVFKSWSKDLNIVMDKDDKIKGKLTLFYKERNFKNACKLLNFIAQDSSVAKDIEILDQDDCKELGIISKNKIAGAFYFKKEETWNYSKLFVALEKYLRSHKKIKFIEGCTVTRWIKDKKAKEAEIEHSNLSGVVKSNTFSIRKKNLFITGVMISNAEGETNLVSADHFVLIGTQDFKKQTSMLGLKCLVRPLSKYSLLAKKHNLQLPFSVSREEKTLSIRILGGDLCITSFGSVKGWKNEVIDHKKCGYLINHSKEILDFDIPETLAMKVDTFFVPITAHAMPIIEKNNRYRNLYFNTGYGNHDFKSVCGGSSILAQIIENPEKIWTDFF